MGHAGDVRDGDEIQEVVNVGVKDDCVQRASVCGVGVGQFTVVVDGGANA